ncbi:unnamed protein product [Coregonus sp. 'balchen']|nr:unnamed protein product [Coregonus sp. 'balchen']
MVVEQRVELRYMKEQVDELRRENEAQAAVLSAIGAKVAASENEVEELKKENADTFTAPVRGVYYFRFTGLDNRKSLYVGAWLMRNRWPIMLLQQSNSHGGQDYLSSGAILKMEQGNSVYMTLPKGYRLIDNGFHNSFSGFLLFPV